MRQQWPPPHFGQKDDQGCERAHAARPSTENIAAKFKPLQDVPIVRGRAGRQENKEINYIFLKKPTVVLLSIIKHTHPDNA